MQICNVLSLNSPNQFTTSPNNLMKKSIRKDKHLKVRRKKVCWKTTRGNTPTWTFGSFIY